MTRSRIRLRRSDPGGRDPHITARKAPTHLSPGIFEEANWSGPVLFRFSGLDVAMLRYQPLIHIARSLIHVDLKENLIFKEKNIAKIKRATRKAIDIMNCGL